MAAILAEATTLVRTVYRLRTQPIGTYEAEDLRVLIAEQISVDVLMPRVLARLEQEPLLEGDFYPGDVLAAVLKVPATCWAANPARGRRWRRSSPLWTIPT